VPRSMEQHMTQQERHGWFIVASLFVILLFVFGTIPFPSCCPHCSRAFRIGAISAYPYCRASSPPQPASACCPWDGWLIASKRAS
jgi:hypothetical protein